MWPFPKKDKHKLPPKPAWLKWLLLAFIGYILIMANAPQHTKTRQVMDAAKEKITSNPALQFGSYTDKIFPEHGANLRIMDVTEGEDQPAVCGQKVRVSYQSFLAQGNELPDHATKEKPLSFTIGDGHVMPVFDRGTIGMKKGGKRSIIAPPLMSYGLEDYRREDVPQGANVRFELELLSAEPSLPSVETSPYRIAEVAIGNGPMILCGEQASVMLTIWDLSGKKIYATDKPITIKPGKSQDMLGLEHGVIGMLTGGTRLLIIPPPYQQTMNGVPVQHPFPLPANHVVMVEVRAQ